MDESQNTHTSIRVALPRRRCGEVRDVVEVLSVLEDVYNHLYALHELSGGDEGVAQTSESRFSRSLPEIENPSDLVPADRRLCLARIEVESPAFIEVVGARYPLETIYHYLRSREPEKEHRNVRAIENIEAVRADIDNLWAARVPEEDIREAVSAHVIAPFRRLERLEGIELYDRDDMPKRRPAQRAPSLTPPSRMARGH